MNRPLSAAFLVAIGFLGCGRTDTPSPVVQQPQATSTASLAEDASLVTTAVPERPKLSAQEEAAVILGGARRLLRDHSKDNPFFTVEEFVGDETFGTTKLDSPMVQGTVRVRHKGRPKQARYTVALIRQVDGTPIPQLVMIHDEVLFATPEMRELLGPDEVPTEEPAGFLTRIGSLVGEEDGVSDAFTPTQYEFKVRWTVNEVPKTPITIHLLTESNGAWIDRGEAGRIEGATTGWFVRRNAPRTHKLEVRGAKQWYMLQVDE